MSDAARGQVSESAAEIYDRFFVPALFAEWPPRVLAAAGVSEGHAVLDVACGTGVLAEAAAAQVGSSGRVTGLDINAGMLDVARSKSPAIDWRHGAAEAMPLPEAQFDRVVSQFGLMFFEDRRQAVREMIRVLRPGGRLAVAVWDSLENTPGYAAVTRLLARLFGEAAAESIRAPYSLGDRRALARLFADTGLDSVEVHTVTGVARFPSLESWMYTDVKGWTLADVIDDEGFERLLKEAALALGDFVAADGSVAFEAPAHIVRAIRP